MYMHTLFHRSLDVEGFRWGGMHSFVDQFPLHAAGIAGRWRLHAILTSSLPPSLSLRLKRLPRLRSRNGVLCRKPASRPDNLAAAC